MNWTPDHYPESMRRLPGHVRLKAIEIANAMLADGCSDREALRIAIEKATQWASTSDPPLVHLGADVEARSFDRDSDESRRKD